MQFFIGIGILALALWIGDLIDKRIQVRNGIRPNKAGRIVDSAGYTRFFWIIIGLMVVWYAINAAGNEAGNPVDDCYGSMKC